MSTANGSDGTPAGVVDPKALRSFADGFAWIGHFVFEKNRPASFQRPLYSFLGDWAMYRDIWRGRIPF
jgi:hypothetical protein